MSAGVGDDPIPAGPFGAWRASLLDALAGRADAEVACGSCVACCTSSQFVHIAPDEADALAHIPAELCFPAPGAPPGHVLLGYDEHGRCPMFRDGGCSIYAHRPRTCRTYDCRVFAATDVDVAVEGKVEIAARAARWRFDHPTAADAADHEAARRAAAHLAAHPEELPGGGPLPATQLAVVAVERADAFRVPPSA